MTRKLSHSTCMLIIEIATLSPSHTFITIILSYSVVMFWSSLSLLFSVSTPGSTSFVQSSNFLFIWTLLIKKSLIKFRDMLNNIDKETKCLNQKRGIKVSQNAKFFAKSRNWGVTKYANLKIAKLTCRENFMSVIRYCQFSSWRLVCTYH